MSDQAERQKAPPRTSQWGQGLARVWPAPGARGEGGAVGMPFAAAHLSPTAQALLSHCSCPTFGRTLPIASLSAPYKL